MFLVPFGRHPNELSRSFDRLFDDHYFDRFFPLAPQPGNGSRSPALDVSESDKAYTARLDLPGVAKEDVKIAIDGRRVSVEATTKKEEEKKEGDRVVYSERSYASYARSFTLPGDVDAAGSAAKLDNGVLTLTLPKRGNGASAQIKVA